MTTPSNPLSPRSIVFWRHLVGIGIVLLAQNPRLYNNAMVFLGLWSGTVAITMGVAGIAAGLGYLFLTTQVQGKTWRIFVGIAWSVAILQLFGQWFLPTIVNKITSTSDSNPAHETQDHTKLAAQYGLEREEYNRRKARADVACREGTFVDFDCWDAILRGSKSASHEKPTYDSKGWTQETTGSTERGPWLRYDPPGTRYYRDAKRIIYRVYPPGLRPNAEPANPFGLGDSTAGVPE